ncbi:GxGYxYP domain-containing protein [Bacteroides sp.]|uniref:GxGYxYP domain-containing protein n=1 Tax=Bacteroides sp. TaxID=29523 RepID=UPI00261BD481|nr:GxGYxYP domain-containing protein [Bacteroides sp.]MDD3036567.1 GxGYxYP family putative glycoside hydrolase [Bacteroides sp.]
MRIYLFYLIPLLISFGCEDSKIKGNDEGGLIEPKTNYLAQVDEPSNRGQFWSLESHVLPKGYYVCPMGNTQPDTNYPELKKGLPYTNMCQSLAGIVNRAVENKECDYAIWLEDPNNRYSYTLCKQELKKQGATEESKEDGIALLKSGRFSHLIKGYVLTDITNNAESSPVAAVASHVHSAIIVDVRDKTVYDEMGLNMVYDARQKTTKDAWREFKDKCNNKSLVLMGALTNDIKDFAITNGLFVLNIRNDKGHNWNLLNEVLDWLKPCSPIYGWEDLDEHSFVQKISEKGHLMVPCNYYMNMSLTSLNYSQRQKDLLVNVINPANRIYPENDPNKYISYYLSDGDNVQWIFHIWYNDWFNHGQTKDVKMAFGIPSTNLSMIAPPVYKNIVDHQGVENTLVENCGGGYIYIDDFASKKDTQKELNSLANKVSAHMRQHRVKVLGLFTNDAKSKNARNAYQTFIKANNRLEGIIVVQYVPYNGGHGETFWFTNSDGIEIPVITVRYTLWNFGKNNSNGQGTPAYVANLLKKEQPDFSLIDIHAWSSFADIGNSDDEVGEAAKGNVSGAGAAAMCQRRLPSNFKCVSLQELIWRMRMKHNREQTTKLLNTYK